MHRLTVIFGFLALAALSAADDPLDAVFAHIDAAAKTFKGMTADISDTEHTAIVDDDRVQNGTVKLLRVKGQTRMLIDLKDPGAQTVALDAHEARVYNPRTNIVGVHDITKYRDLVNQYLVLGFGATSTELKTTYDVTYVGGEKIDSRQTSHIILVPKSAETRRNLKQAELWYGDGGLVAQQKFLWPAGDYKLVTYRNMKQRDSIPDKELELNVPKGATIQKMDK